MKKLAENFWNFRGSFRIAGLIDVGTQMSLVRRNNGRFILLDSYELKDDDLSALKALTDGGDAIEAIINVHPFHTLHCTAVHNQFPHARLIGTKRHHTQVPELPWDDAAIEDPDTQSGFSDVFDFSIPAGVDFISANSKVHVASVLVRHRESEIVHVDDTINILKPPSLLNGILPQPRLHFHPMLGKALKNNPGASDEYAKWARDIAKLWSDVKIVCAAHSGVLELQKRGWREEILEALSDVESVLDKHRKSFR